MRSPSIWTSLGNTDLMSIANHSETSVLSSDASNGVTRLPSPPRGRGAGGQGDFSQPSQLLRQRPRRASEADGCPTLAFPLFTPDPFSRVGASWQRSVLAAACAHSCHLLAIRTVEPGRSASRQSAHQCQLTAMMYAVKQKCTPEDLPNRHGLSCEERDRMVEVLRFQLPDAVCRFMMNSLISGGQRFNGSRAFDVGWLHRH